MRVLALVVKEIRTFLRDLALVFVVLFLFVVHPSQSASQMVSTLNNYPIAVSDLDRSQSSAAFIQRLRAPYFEIRRHIQREAEIVALLEGDDVSMVIVIPEGFSRRIHQGRPAAVQVISDGTYSVTSQRAGAYVMAIAAEFAAAQQGTLVHGGEMPVVDARIRMRYNPLLQADWPAGLSMLLEAVTIVSILLPAAFMVREREQGTIEQLLVSPLRPWEITASKLIPMMVLTVVVTLASLMVLVRVFDLPIRGSLALFLAATALMVFSMGAISLVVATIARTLPSALILSFMLIIPIALLSGNYTPVEAMPAWQYYLTLLSPQRYYLNLGYGIVLKNATFRLLWQDFLGLSLVGSGLFALGVRRFQRQFG
jgi:ABC-2 type transport system permease protein